MTNRKVAIIALILTAALVGSSSIAEARKGEMSPNCLMTGAHYNYIVKRLDANDKRLDALEVLAAKLMKRRPDLAIKIKRYVVDQRVQVKLVRIKLLKAKIAKLKKALAKLRKSRMHPLAKKAAVKALEAEIAKLEKELKALKAKLALLPLRPSARPIVDATALRALTKALNGLHAVVNKLVRNGFRSPELEKKLDQLLASNKLTQSLLLDNWTELSAIRRRLNKGIKVISPDSGPKPIWAGWHFRAGPLVGFTALNGSDVLALRLQIDVSGEWVDYKTHLGIRFGLAMGGLITRATDEGGRQDLVFPFMVTGHVASVAMWKYFGVILPEFSASFVQNPLTGRQGSLWVQVHAGVEVHAYRALSVSALIGTSLHGEDQRLTGLSAMFRFQYLY